MTTAPRTAHRILVVEDDPNLVEILGHQLRRDGYEIKTVSSGYDAAYEIQNFRPHLVFLDLMLPGVDGAEICRRLRADEELREIRLIGMSASTDTGKLATFWQAGLDDFMPKPFKLAEIRERVEKQIGPIRVDASAFDRNRVLVFSAEAAWSEAVARELQVAGYVVERASTPVAAGFAAARLTPEAVVVRAGDEAASSIRRNGAPILAAGDPQAALAEVRAALGPIVPRREPHAPSRTVVPLAVAAVALLAVVAGAIFIWPGRTPAELPPGQRVFEGVPRNEEEIGWIEQERRARDQHLVFYGGAWYRRALLGEGHRVTTKSRTLEGLLAESKEGFVLRASDGAVKLSAAEIVSKERVRLPYEEYWDREAALDERDAEGHYQVGLWCRAQKLAEVAARQFRRAVIANPDHDGARRELGYEKRDGRWVRGR